MSVPGLYGLPKPAPPDEPSRLETALEELRGFLVLLPAEISAALQRAVTALPQPPSPQVHVDAPDLAEIVMAVQSLRQGATADEIAQAVQRTLAPQPLDFTPVSETMAAVGETLKKLEFRLQAPQTHVAGPGSVGIRYTTPGDLKVNADGSINTNTTLAVSNIDIGKVDQGTAGASAWLTDPSDRSGRLLGHVTVDNSSVAVTGPLTDTQLRATAVPVSGTVSTGLTQPLTDTQLRATAVPVSGTFWQATQPTKETRSTASAVSSFAASVTNATILASNANRLGATIHNNNASANLYVKLGATATTTAGGFTVKIAAGGYYEVPFNYTGIIDGIWDSASGNAASVTELT